MSWYLKVLRQYADFDGRARRTEYWMFTLLSVIISIVLAIIDNLLGLTYGAGAAGTASTGILGSIYSLAVLLPTLAVAARRLHDTGRSGWLQLITLVPTILMFGSFAIAATNQSSAFLIIAGILALVTIALGILLIVWLATDGNRGPNQYGENPKEVGPVPA